MLLDSPADFPLEKAPDLSFIWKNLLCIAFFYDKMNYEKNPLKRQKYIYAVLGEVFDRRLREDEYCPDGS